MTRMSANRTQGSMQLGTRARLGVVAGAAALLLAACGGDDGSADSDGDVDDSGDPQAGAAEFYDGATLTMAITGSPGGNSDTVARIVAPYLAEELGADIIPENNNTGAGIAMLNEMANTAPKDGTYLGVATGAQVFIPPNAGTEGVQYTPDDVQWLLVVDDTDYYAYAGADSEVETWADLLAQDGTIRFGTQGPGRLGGGVLALAGHTFGIDYEWISGFEGGGELRTALERGDIDLYGSSGTNLDEDGIRPILSFADERDTEQAPDVPTIYEYFDDEETVALVEATQALSIMQRAFVVSPDIPADRLEYLQQAMENIADNEEMAAELSAIGISDARFYGDELEEMRAAARNAPAELWDMFGEG